MDARNQHTGPPRGRQRLRAHRAAAAAGVGQPRPGGRSTPRPALPAQLLAAPSAPSRVRAGAQATPRARHSPGWGFRPPLPDAPHAFVRRHRCPLRRRRAHLGFKRFSAAAPEGPGAVRAAKRARGARFLVGAGRRQRMPGSRSRWARLASAWLGSRWPLLRPDRAHVLPRRRSGALCRGSGAGEKSKHLAGFPQPRPGPAS